MSHAVFHPHRLALIGLGLIVSGCLTTPAVDDAPRVRMNLSLERPAQGAPLKAMVITLASSRGDTLRDTITDQGARLAGAQVILNPPADQGQVLVPRYDLPYGGHWTCGIVSFDAQDSVIHQDGCEIGALEPGETREVALRLAARVAAYEAVFHPRAHAPGGRPISLERFELDIDGVTQCAASLGPSPVTGPVTIDCAYLPTGSGEAVTRVYGRVGDEATDRLLWTGHAPVEIRNGSGRVLPLTLTWQPPHGPGARALGKQGERPLPEQTDPHSHELASMDTELRLGRVGKVVMNVTMSAAVVL